jgi:predicted transcriptional regulator
MVSGRRGNETPKYILKNPYINLRITRIIAYFRIIALLKNNPLDTTSIVKALDAGYSTTCRYLNHLMAYGVIRIKQIGKNGRRIYELTPDWKINLFSIPNIHIIEEFQAFLDIVKGSF